VAAKREDANTKPTFLKEKGAGEPQSRGTEGKTLRLGEGNLDKKKKGDEENRTDGKP